MDLRLKAIPGHDVILIPCPGHLVKLPLSCYRNIIVKDESFKILSYIVHKKGEFFPEALSLLSTGALFDDQEVWNKYPNSNRLIFFICRKQKK